MKATEYADLPVDARAAEPGGLPRLRRAGVEVGFARDGGRQCSRIVSLAARVSAPAAAPLASATASAAHAA